VKAHYPSEGECRVCGITTVRTLTCGAIYLREGRVLNGHVDCDWNTPTIPPPPSTMPAPPDTTNE